MATHIPLSPCLSFRCVSGGGSIKNSCFQQCNTTGYIFNNGRARPYEMKSLDKDVHLHYWFLHCNHMLSLKVPDLCFFFFFFFFFFKKKVVISRYSLISFDRNNVHWMSSSSKNRMSSVRKNLSLYKMQYITCHSWICQAETILLGGICISWKNEINVLKLIFLIIFFNV